MSKSLIRKDYLVNGSNKLISCYDTDYNIINLAIMENCQKICKVECNFIYYPLEIERNDEPEEENHIWIHHSEYPDIYVEHIPEMNMIHFLCDFGGLLGMWLGLSLFGILNGIFNILRKIDYRK